MNMFVASAAFAAAPAIAAPMDSAPPSPVIEGDHKAILARVELVVELLRTRHIRDGWTIDEDAATRAVQYFRRHVEGPPFENEDEDTLEYHHAVRFLCSHGQSVDWVHDGDVSGMICRLAKDSQRSRGQAGADPIADRIDAHRKANAEYSAAVSELYDTPREGELDSFGDREADARHDLVSNGPLTLAGLLAVLTYVADVSDGKYSTCGRPDSVFDRYDLLDVIVGAQDCLRDHPGWPAGV